jgi:hypothetical protein
MTRTKKEGAVPEGAAPLLGAVRLRTASGRKNAIADSRDRAVTRAIRSFAARSRAAAPFADRVKRASFGFSVLEKRTP